MTGIKAIGIKYMKILFVTTCYPTDKNPQYCIFLEQQAKALIENGCTAEVLYLSDEAKAKREYVQNGVKVYVYPIDKSNKFDIFFPTSLSTQNRKDIIALLKGRYDIVSFHFGGNKVKRTLLKACKNANIPLILHFHGLNVWYEQKENHKFLYDYLRIQYRSLYKRMNAVVGVSNKVKDEFLKKVSSVPAYTVYNGVDLQKFAFLNRRELKRPLRLICVANLIDLKGQDLLIDAVKRLKEKGINCLLTLVGSGPNEQKLKAQAEKSGIAENVTFTGSLPYEKTASKLKDNDIFIMPSYYEALGCVYLEAMSSGLITVGVKNQGIDEIIKDGENGFLAEPKSVSSIVCAIERIAEMPPEQVSAVSENANKTARSYTWDNSAKQLIDVYKKTLGGKN